jgi:hypothetical protein
MQNRERSDRLALNAFNPAVPVAEGQRWIAYWFCDGLY